MKDSIRVRGARTHNLRGIDCDIPHGALTVVTGVSGSGKSSLAFDTIHAEGQRRYVETLSTYARQFLQELGRPPVDELANLPPSLALRQGNSVNNARSNVGTLTELADHLQLLFARAGTTQCRACGGRVERATPRSVVDWLSAHAEEERILLLGSLRVDAEEEGSAAKLLKGLALDGFRKFWRAGEVVEIDTPEASALLEDGRLDVVLDRLRVSADDARILEAVEQAFALGEGVARVVLWDRRNAEDERETRLFDPRFRCIECGTAHTEPIPALLKPQSQLGACEDCEGFGRTVGLDPARVIPDPRLSIRDGAVVPFQMPSTRRAQRALLAACGEAGIDVDVPWQGLTPSDRGFVLRGGKGYEGVRGFFKGMESDRYKPHVRIFIARFRGYATCETCDGTGLNAHARAVRLGGYHIGEVLALRIEEAKAWVEALVLPEDRSDALAPLLAEIRQRYRYLVEAGVPYLTLDRPARTLSGGEMHRVLLATTLGRILTETCYVLDEPTAGLHAHDTERLIGLIEKLRDAGNTVLVVEHDTDVMARADHILELGPAGGEKGGELLFAGSVEALRGCDTATALALREPLRLTGTPPPRDVAWLEVADAVLHNLRDVQVRFPHGHLSVVTGVSGSGKSTLVHDVLYRKLMESRGYRSEDELGPVRVEGDVFEEIVLVDQGSISRSSRSCPLTFSGAYTPIRELFAQTREAAAQGLRAGAFSFNTPGGRCERCEGLGHVRVEMHFMADIDIPCDVCGGLRFRENVLAVRWRDRNIADVFAMTVDEARALFGELPAIARRLESLHRVGLGYLRLGQATTELSGGEAQRLKLAGYVGQSGDRDGSARLFLFDEPTVGLHASDVARLLRAIRHLTERGHTVVCVEHNLDFVSACDWVVDMGPGAGPAGGRVLHCGPVAALAEVSESRTGAHLARRLGGGKRPPGA